MNVSLAFNHLVSSNEIDEACFIDFFSIKGPLKIWYRLFNILVNNLSEISIYKNLGFYSDYYLEISLVMENVFSFPEREYFTKNSMRGIWGCFKDKYMCFDFIYLVLSRDDCIIYVITIGTYWNIKKNRIVQKTIANIQVL